jgi:CRP-like cAMP-binding protein
MRLDVPINLQVKLVTLSKGQMIGEAAAFKPKPEPAEATVVAASPVTLVCVHVVDLTKYIDPDDLTVLYQMVRLKCETLPLLAQGDNSLSKLIIATV